MLEIDYRDDRVVLCLTNPISAAPVESGTPWHRGLDGIRKRVELFDGTVEYGPWQDDSRWRVVVSVPVVQS